MVQKGMYFASALELLTLGGGGMMLERRGLEEGGGVQIGLLLTSTEIGSQNAAEIACLLLGREEKGGGGGEGGVNLLLIALYPLKGPALTFGRHGAINRAKRG